MFTKPTTFILGAGASHPYKYPLGSTLIEQILNLAGAEVQSMLKLDWPEFIKFQNELRTSHQPSIDAFLNHRSEFLHVGKRAIAHCIAHCEQFSVVHQQDWYSLLLNRIAPSFEAIKENKLTIVTFNYDRSLEHFLFIAIKARFGKTDAQVAEAMQSLSIQHVYGSLSRLPWQPEQGRLPKDVRAYGDREPNAVFTAAHGIKLIHERQESSLLQDTLDRVLSDSETIYILGFGFLRENMEWIRKAQGGPVLATCFGMTNAQRRAIKNNYMIDFADYSQTTANTFLINADRFVNDQSG